MELQSDYDENAKAYSQFLTTPLGILEQQLCALAIPNCTGLHVLDLGGGTGLRARDALNAGAARVDVVDISPEMMRLGQQQLAESERDGWMDGRIRWLHGDVSADLDGLGLRVEGYDVVVANGVFDHARDARELDAMWRNCARCLKPGGRLVGNRNNPMSAAARRSSKSGVEFSDFRPFEGGFRYRYHVATEPPLDFESIALDVYFRGSLEIPGRYFVGFDNVPWESTEVVKGDAAFWEEYLEDPILYIFTAQKPV